MPSPTTLRAGVGAASPATATPSGCPSCGGRFDRRELVDARGRVYVARLYHLSAACPVYVGPKRREDVTAHLLAMPSEVRA